MTEKSILSHPAEGNLVDRAKVDPASFLAIYDHYFSAIYNFARYRVSDPATADDLTSEIFENTLKHLHSYNPERGEFTPWLWAIARNTVNSYLRKQRIRRWVSLEDFRDHDDGRPHPDAAVVSSETRHELLSAVSRLDDRERELIALKYASGLTNRAISRLTGLTETNVGVIIHRAIKRIRAEIDEGDSLQ